MLTSNDKFDALSLLLAQARKGLDSQRDILLALETVDAQNDLALLPVNLAASTLLILRPRINARVHDLELALPHQRRPSAADDATREFRVDGNGVSKAHAPALVSIEGDAVGALPPLLAALGEQQVGEVAVEEDRGGGAQELQQRKAGAKLVDEEVVWLEGGELAGPVDGEQEVGLAEDGAEDHEA